MPSLNNYCECPVCDGSGYVQREVAVATYAVLALFSLCLVVLGALLELYGHWLPRYLIFSTH